jgi:tetratricopeptide (TPR) repeat protein/predicted Ser/Thr protein kinase
MNPLPPDSPSPSADGLGRDGATYRPAPTIAPELTADDAPTTRTNDGEQQSTLGWQPTAAELQSLPDIPQHDVLRVVARGGMGVVLEARHRVLGRPVAVKLPLVELLSDSQRERFLQEARAASQLRHPNICSIHEVGESGGRPFITMDFIRGVTLREWYRQGDVTARQSATMLALLARAVAYAHERGVVHRDLKPSNVMVDADTGQPVLMDFGLAKEATQSSSQLTRSGDVLGTPAYMAPEQAAGRTEEVGPAADVYALGAILYELLAGRPAFTGPVGEVLKRVQTEEPPPPRKRNPRIHRDLETICLKAMAKESSQRYASAQLLAEDLERFNAGEAILARRAGPASRVWRRARRSPWLTAAAVLMMAVAAGAAAIAGRAEMLWRISRASADLDARLETTEWSAPQLREIDDLIAELAQHDPEQAAQARARVAAAWADDLDARIREPALDDPQVAALREELGQLAARDNAAAQRLDELLTKRERAWRTVLDLPGAGDIDQALPGAVRDDTGTLQRGAMRATPGGVVLVDLAGGDFVELQVRFAATWEATPSIGVSLNTIAPSQSKPVAAGAEPEEPPVVRAGYAVRLTAERPEGTAIGGTVPCTFAEARAGGTFVLEILRDAQPLQRQSIDPADVPPGACQLLAQREGERLLAQVNSLPPLAFTDVFPLSRTRPGVFGIDWPPQVAIERLSVRRRAPPAEANALEQGDELYGTGQHAAALDQYLRQAAAAAGTPTDQQARFKQALCLLALERTDEAQQLLQVLAVEAGERWPLLAASQLWLSLAEADRWDDADAVFDSLAVRYGPADFLRQVPIHARQRLLAAYSRTGGGLAHYLPDPQRIARLERRVQITELVGQRMEHDWSQWELLRSLHAAGRHDEATELADRLVHQYDVHDPIWPLNWVEEHAWLLRSAGRHDESLATIDRVLDPPEGPRRMGSEMLLLERARTLAALGRIDEAEDDLARLLQLAEDPELQAGLERHAIAARLAQGFLCEARGDVAAAQEAWRLGAAAANPDGGVTLMVLADRTILWSLADELTDQRAEWIIDQAVQAPTSANASSDESATPGVNGAMLAFVVQRVRPLAPEVLRRMWQSPRGHELARQISLREIPFDALIRRPAVLAVHEVLRQRAYPNAMSPAEDEATWVLVDRLFEEFFMTGRLASPHAMALALTWEGQTNLLGWAGLAPSLEPEYRSGMAYIFGQRYLHHRQDPQQATAFFQTAVQDAPADGPWRDLAQLALDSLSMPPAGETSSGEQSP